MPGNERRRVGARTVVAGTQFAARSVRSSTARTQQSLCERITVHLRMKSQGLARRAFFGVADGAAPCSGVRSGGTAIAQRVEAMLLCLSSFAICEIRECVVEESVEVSGGVALEAALDFSGAASFGLAAGCVGAGLGVVAHAAEDDRVERSVELSVAASVEAVTDGLS